MHIGGPEEERTRIWAEGTTHCMRVGGLVVRRQNDVVLWA